MTDENAIKILKGAEQLFFKYGIKNVTMDDIAKHLSVSKKTIYQYFKDKDTMIHNLVELTLKEDKCIIQKSQSESTNVVHEAFNLMENMREFFSKINPILFYELNKYYPETWKLFLNFKNDFVLKSVENSLIKGQKEGYIRLDINLKLLSRLRVELIELAMNGKRMPHNQYGIIEIHTAFTEHFLYGVCTLKGHRLINKYKNIEED